MFIFRKSLLPIVQPVIVNVEAEVEVRVEAEVEVTVEAKEVVAEAEEVTTTEVERVVALPLKCATQLLKPRPHLHFEAKWCLP